jgi:hypothetical protein
VRSLIKHVDAFIDMKKTVLCQFASKYRGVQNVGKVRRKLFLLTKVIYLLPSHNYEHVLDDLSLLV